jgi:hypothetical protein
MKKSLVITTLLSVLFMFDARADGGSIDHEAMRVIAVICVMVLIALFILTFLRYILDSRIKNRIIDKGISQDLATSLITNTKKDDKLQTLKWFCLLAATGLGLMLVYYTLPLDIHSFAIMCFSISIGYLGYYFIMKQFQK